MLLSVFTVKETICPIICSKSLPKSSKSQLSVDMRRSKTSLFKLPIKVDAGAARKTKFILVSVASALSSSDSLLSKHSSQPVLVRCLVSQMTSQGYRPILSGSEKQVWKIKNCLDDATKKKISHVLVPSHWLCFIVRPVVDMHIHFFKKIKRMLFFRTRLNNLIFLPILG